VATSESRLILTPVPLEPAGFAPYGEVIDRRDARLARAINDGSAARLDGLGRVDAELEGAHVGISLVRAISRGLPFRLQCVERHQLGTQAFVPLRGSRWLVVVAPAGRAPEASGLRAFIATSEQGVNYARGTWHHPLIAIDDGAEFVVIDRIIDDGRGDDCEVLDLAASAVWIEALMPRT
jgi:ureidoglycolate lyase